MKLPFNFLARFIPAMPSPEKALGVAVLVLVAALVVVYLYLGGKLAMKDTAIANANTAAVALQGQKDALEVESLLLQSTADILVKEANAAKVREEANRESYLRLKADNAKTTSDLSKTKAELASLRNKPGTPDYELLNQKITDDVVDMLNGDTPGVF